MNTKKLIVALALTTPLLFSCTRRDSADVPATNTNESTNPATINNDTTTTPDSATYDTTTGANPEVSAVNTRAVDSTATTGAVGTTGSTTTSGTTATTTETTTTRTRMGTGVTSSQLVQAQRALQQRGYTVSNNDLGGPETTRALQQFQAEKDLQVTGTLDTETLRALEIPGSSDRVPASVNDDVD